MSKPETTEAGSLYRSAQIATVEQLVQSVCSDGNANAHRLAVDILNALDKLQFWEIKRRELEYRKIANG